MYLHPGNVSYSAIELTVTDPSLLLEFSWKVHGDLCRSDQFPITLKILSFTIGKDLHDINLTKLDLHDINLTKLDLHDINLTKLTGLCTNRCPEKNFKRNL
jgi:uncharacterized protein YjbI with pentapeptide repeats